VAHLQDARDVRELDRSCERILPSAAMMSLSGFSFTVSERADNFSKMKNCTQPTGLVACSSRPAARSSHAHLTVATHPRCPLLCGAALRAARRPPSQLAQLAAANSQSYRNADFKVLSHPQLRADRGRRDGCGGSSHVSDVYKCAAPRLRKMAAEARAVARP
jgi:hypothetical protein